MQFCADEGLLLLADEVYQENIWTPDKPFISFKKVLRDFGPDHSAAGLQLASFHSVSKGFIGECGLRGGYVELTNLPADVTALMYKVASISLCSNVQGQVMTGLMVNPPAPGSVSHEGYVVQRDSTLASLRRRAALLSESLNQLTGVSCQPLEGALYAFPTVTLPEAAARAADAMGMAPDAFYCMQLLEATGIVTVPGSGFGQKDGTFHFRCTILPSEKDMAGVMTSMADFHEEFIATFSTDGDSN